jgi:ectoine hydroxylase-related dioxygenase (phytanoyl-CoA dioxygenase family)
MKMNTNRVFLDDQLQEEFEKKGVVKIKLLSDEEVGILKELHKRQNPNERFNTHNANDANVSYHFSFLDSNKDLKTAVFNEVSKLVQPRLDKVLDNYEPLVINFVNKEPGFGEVPCHQNWDFVDERKFVSVSVWCALVDVTENDGALEFIEGTHQLYRNEVLRSPSIPWYFKEYIEDLKSDFLKPIEVKAGEVLIFDDSIIHYSKVNKGKTDRLVVQIIAKPKAAQAKHYYLKNGLFNKTIEEMDVNTDFFLNFKFAIKERPDETFVSGVRKIPHKLPKIPLTKFKKDISEYHQLYLQD